jgi:autotransporter-associated beta strand protein
LANGSTSAANTANLMIGAGRSVNNAITVTSNSADTNSTDVRQIGGNFTTGTASYTGAISVGAQKQALGLQVTATDAGRVNFTNTISGAGAITKVGTGTVSFSRPGPNGNTYTGGTTIAAGTFLANGVNSTGTGAVVVNGGATLGGSGALGNATTGAVTAQAGAFLAPGDGGAGTLTFNGALDVSGLASGTGGLLFDLGATSDQIVLSAGTLNIGAGILNFDDFNFTTLTGFDVGSYTLIATSTSIVGTLGSALTGTVGGLNGVLSMVGDDIVLTVTSIPEPSTYAALFGVVALGGAAWRRRAGLRSRSV